MKLIKKRLEQTIKEGLKPTIAKPSKMGAKLKDSFKKELSKSSTKQGLKKKPNIKLSETDDSAAMKRSAYNDLGVGKKDKKKDLDPSFKSLTFESLEYIDESDTKEDSGITGPPVSMKPAEYRKWDESFETSDRNWRNKVTNGRYGRIYTELRNQGKSMQEAKRRANESLPDDFKSMAETTIPLKTIKRDINEDKKLISKKQLIENTLKEDNKSTELDDLYLEETKLEEELRSYRADLEDEKDPKERENLRDSINEVMNEIVEIRQKISNLSPNILSKYKMELEEAMMITPLPKGHGETIKENNDNKSGLIVIGRTQIDNNKIKDLIDREGFTAEWNSEYGNFFFPEKEETYDSLETELSILFNRNGINARFEGVFNQLDETYGSKENQFIVLKVKGGFGGTDTEDKARTIAHENNLKLIGGLFTGKENTLSNDGYYQGRNYKVIDVPDDTKPTEDPKGKFISQIIDYESGNLSEKETLALFSNLIKSGYINHLQGHYGRMANELMKRGLLSTKGDILKFSLNELKEIKRKIYKENKNIMTKKQLIESTLKEGIISTIILTGLGIYFLIKFLSSLIGHKFPPFLVNKLISSVKKADKIQLKEIRNNVFKFEGLRKFKSGIEMEFDFIIDLNHKRLEIYDYTISVSDEQIKIFKQYLNKMIDTKIIKEAKKKTKLNPWAACSSSVGREDKEKYEKCVKSIKKQQGIDEQLTEEQYLKELELIDETTTSSSSGQFQTPHMWAPNKKGWANKDKKWWGKNSPNTGGNISKGGIVNIKDNCKGYSNSKTQCNSGDISNITLTEDVKKIINKLSKEYNKKPDYIEKLIKEDFNNKKQIKAKYVKTDFWNREIYKDDNGEYYVDVEGTLHTMTDEGEPMYPVKNITKLNESICNKRQLNEKLTKVTDKQISEFVKKQLIKEGYLKQTKDNWRGEGCKDYDDSRDICLDKEVNEDTFTSGEIPDDNHYGQIDSDNVMDYVIKYENHELGTDKMIELISYLIKSERIDNMDPEYIEIARRMILNQDLDNEGNILFSKIPVSTPKSADAFSLNEKKIIKITEKELKDILEDKLKENYPPGNNSSYTTPNDVIGELPLYDM